MYFGRNIDITMRRNTFTILLIVVVMAFNTFAQDNRSDGKDMSKNAEQKLYKIDPKDVSTIDGIIAATYDVISGEADQKRNWDRFRSLFHKDGRLIPTNTNSQNGLTGARAFTPEEYIERSEPFMMKNGFFEKETARRIESFGNIAHIFSTYEGRNKLSDVKPFLRGINSFQLLNDGIRWWIVTIYWQAETPDNLLPQKYLKSN